MLPAAPRDGGRTASADRPWKHPSHLLYPRGVSSRFTPSDDPLGLGPAEHLYRALVEQIPAVVYIDSNDHKPQSLYVSPQVIDMIGYTPDEWLNDATLWGRTIHPFDRDRVRCRVDPGDRQPDARSDASTGSSGATAA